ncbi:MAG TPA: prepilin-type N-terminal cleavage/methylation domain-containing protein [Gemmatimonadaceae bacterium]|nr:prepilin-type N-terminal cleavage/methylation domain-containing protein [Gemmatimonadaceae bacterium]
MRTVSRIRRARPRRGFTLPELMISIVLFGVIMAVVMNVLTRQQRFHRGASAMVELRGQMRQATHALPADLRALWPAGGDIDTWSASSIGFRAFSGSSIVCRRPTSTTLVLPPLTLTQNNTLTTWLTQPQVGDSVLVYDENLLIGNADDVWRGYLITAVASVTGVNACGATSGYTVAGDVATLSWQLTIDATMSTTIIPGAPIRIFRRATYELYEASDGRWYLGASDCLPGRTPVCSDPQAVGGPFRAWDTDPALSGLALAYFDATGTELDPATADPAAVVRIEITVRGQTDTPFSTTQATGHTSDSLSFVVGLRNRD